LRLYFGSPAHAKRVKEAEKVVLVEGEKCVHALHQIGVVATTKPGGSSSVSNTDWSVLYGKKVVLWPDNDKPGKEYMAKVGDILRPHCDLYMIDPEEIRDNIPNKYDAADMYAETTHLKNQKDIFSLVIEEAYPYGSGSSTVERYEKIFAGEWRNIEWPWPQLSKLTKALLPGTITLLCGGEGDGKSMFMSYAMVNWLGKEDWVAFHLEGEDAPHYLMRAMAQKAQDSRLVDDEWLRNNAEEAKGLIDKKFLDEFGNRIWQSTEKEQSRDDVREWIRERAKEGHSIIIVDPITAVETEDKIWGADASFVWAVKTIVTEHSCRLIMVTHRTKQGKDYTLQGLAGGTAYARKPQVILWIESFAEAEEVQVATSTACGSYEGSVECNKLVHIKKCRNGKGQGLTMAFYYNPATMGFEEKGFIVNKKK